MDRLRLVEDRCGRIEIAGGGEETAAGTEGIGVKATRLPVGQEVERVARLVQASEGDQRLGRCRESPQVSAALVVRRRIDGAIDESQRRRGVASAQLQERQLGSHRPFAESPACRRHEVECLVGRGQRAVGVAQASEQPRLVAEHVDPRRALVGDVGEPPRPKDPIPSGIGASREKVERGRVCLNEWQARVIAGALRVLEEVRDPGLGRAMVPIRPCRC
jgi:hypothetical protein